MKKLLMTAMILAFAASAYAGTGVKNSKHDIPATFPGAQGVVDEATAEGGRNRICGYCHTPHHADIDSANQGLPLWSRSQSSNIGSYANYTSFTLDGDLADDNLGNAEIGSSWLCLSCHDGTVAVDQHYDFGGNQYLNNDSFSGSGTAVGLGGDLTNDHPIGVDMAAAYTNEGTGGAQTGLKDPATAQFLGNTLLGAFTISNYLYDGTILTCSSCHDVHNKDTVDEPYMLYASLDESKICFSCHDK